MTDNRINYPVNYEYDKNEGPMFDGFAATAEDARNVMSDILTEANGEPTEAPEPYLATTEVGPQARSKADVEFWWPDEIEEGYCAPLQVYGGWVAEITYWAV